MFKNFTEANVGTQTQAKSSVARQIRDSLVDLYPGFDIDLIFPKKANLQITKGKGELNYIKFLGTDGLIMFFQDRDGPWLPTLPTVKKFPALMPKMQVDKGATDFLLRGANIMAPGLTSPGGVVLPGVEKDRAVQIFIEGQNDPSAIGVMLMSSDEM
jgi:PUA domain protein